MANPQIRAFRDDLGHSSGGFEKAGSGSNIIFLSSIIGDPPYSRLTIDVNHSSSDKT
jgi:hypothetical protein